MLDALDLQHLPFNLALLPHLDLLASLLLFVVLWIARKIVVGVIRARAEVPSHDQRRLLASSRNVFLFLLLVGLVLIWAPQLRTFALSLTAVAVAIVVATKELILCLSGSVLRATSRAFSVGDWIEIGDIRGEVTDHTLLATTLQEFGSGPHAYMPTGRNVVLPNSMLLTTPLRNHTTLREHTYHSFAITLDKSPEIAPALKKAQEIVQHHYAPLFERARQENAAVEHRTRTNLPDPDPVVRFRTSDLGKLRVEVTVFCPSQSADTIESEITSDILASFQSMEADRINEDKPEKKNAEVG
ncbi:Mechanosensitive ion channel [Roseovarius tolerans]|uniref:Mechanosensitive ion channel n=1 Tax=Roseovarius tolerans TaxID=74031 RepID=A0A0L6CQK2_9RHOB|nr:mechanosensitive ion channel domain-containing protein [Roseovarius tolerans]KNX40022.1 Mechanosensitive ion channel [Roseovarius tolerans]